MKPLGQLKPNLVGIFIEWSTTKIFFFFFLLIRSTQNLDFIENKHAYDSSERCRLRWSSSLL